MNRREKSLAATPYPGAPVVSWPVGEAAPELPAGKAGISVWIRTRAIDPPSFVAPRAVGVDDRPMWHGLGRMVVVTEPGEHLVEVGGWVSSVETARLVRVRAGEIVELEYWKPASFGSVDGVLVPAPARRRLGSGGWGVVAGFLALMCVAWLAEATEEASKAVFAVFTALFFVAPLAVVVLWSLVKRRIDRRYRVAMSYEATADTRAADTGMFLGDGDAPAGLADGIHGVLVVTGTAARKYVWNRLTPPAMTFPTADPNAWLPWPSMIIDGVERPFSWRRWCYRLPPGKHEVTVTVRPPLLGEGQDRGDKDRGDKDRGDKDRGRFGAEPVTVTVDIAAGRVTRLDLRVKATTEVVSTTRDRRGPTEPTRFEASVEMRASTPMTPGK
ncbi:hypothetical protein [Actinomadura sp. HBU206391]|uniref:hypothetical protein n=1 Tax=Actinomadura sp. HBU206391 TaxID=2731692 RepID=UPI0016509AF7|nr:hypothetical protein [Actinomadura sp. HBU206391]MBC6458512.1 hypothetical protein [Actinomadura sp. HBU206391]